MKIVIFNTLQDKEVFYIKTNSIKTILNYLKNMLPLDKYQELISCRVCFILGDSLNKKRQISLRGEAIPLISLQGYDTLIIVKDIEGKSGAWQWVSLAVAAVLTVVTFGQAWWVIALTMLAWTAISIGVAMLLAPSMHLQGDPAVAQQQQSNLFGNLGLIREQGGVYPLIFGRPTATGVLINSALVTSDVVT